MHDGIVPATPILAEVERSLSGKMGRELVLRKALKDARKQHDVILIDCPPALGLLTINGLVAADWALISSEAQYFALQGVQGALEVIEQAKEFYNPDLEWLGRGAEHRRHAHGALARGLRAAEGALRRQGVRDASSAPRSPTPSRPRRAVSILDHRPDLGADYLALADEVLAAHRPDATPAGRSKPLLGRAEAAMRSSPSPPPRSLLLAGCGGDGGRPARGARGAVALEAERRRRTSRAGRAPEAAAGRRALHDRARAAARRRCAPRPAGACWPGCGQRTEFGSPSVLAVTGAARRLAARDRVRAHERRAAAGSAPAPRGSAPPTSRCASTAPRAGSTLRHGKRVLRRCRSPSAARATRRRSAASRSPTCCGPQSPDSPVRLLRGRAVGPPDQAAARAGPAATGSRSTARRTRRRSARPPRSAACARTTATIAGARCGACRSGRRCSSCVNTVSIAARSERLESGMRTFVRQRSASSTATTRPRSRGSSGTGSTSTAISSTSAPRTRARRRWRRSVRPVRTSSCWTRWARPATPRSSGASERGPEARRHRLQRLRLHSSTTRARLEADAYIEKGDDDHALVAMIRAVAACQS